MDDKNKLDNREGVVYQKEFFITPDGEILKFAAIVENNPPQITSKKE